VLAGVLVFVHLVTINRQHGSMSPTILRLAILTLAMSGQ
jgi:hypothetical protein